MNELDEYAVEEALKIAEATSGEVTVLSMGPEQSTETIRKALSMGADAGIHVLDDPCRFGCCGHLFGHRHRSGDRGST